MIFFSSELWKLLIWTKEVGEEIFKKNFCLDFAEKFNVLWRDNWTLAAGDVLRKFEKEVIDKTKNEGYDGNENTNHKQWSFPGALLYSVTVITTIGKFLYLLILES